MTPETIDRLAAHDVTREQLDRVLSAASHLGERPAVRAWRRANRCNMARGLRQVTAARDAGVPTMFGALYLTHLLASGEEVDYGLVSLRVVTTAGVNWIVSAFANTVEMEIMKYHGLGTGATAEAIGDTALVTELTTEYNPNSTRATGTTTTGATSNVYRTVATNTVDASAAITEHGIFSQAATGGGTLLDRSVFAVINLANGDGLASTYDCTFSAGG